MIKQTKYILSLLLASSLIACGGGQSGKPGAGGTNTPARNVTVSGVISVGEASVIDSDVNDYNAKFVANDTIGNAQLVPNPATIGGYVNAPGAGPTGRSQIAGDERDFFQAAFVAGQVLMLHIASPEAADLDLRLYDAQGALVDAALGSGDIETLTVPANGNYFVEVLVCEEACMVRGASTYVLTIGQPRTMTRTAVLRLSDEFVPGDIIARFDEQTSTARALTMDDPLQTLALKAKAGQPERGMLLSVEPKTTATIRAVTDSPTAALPFVNDEQRLKYETLLRVKALRQRGDIIAADPNYIVKPLLVPNDTFFSAQWNLEQINMPAAWDISTGSTEVIVGVVDTGALFNHPDIAGQFVAGYDFIRSVTNALDGDGIDADPTDPGDMASGGSSSFHGTHVSGTVAARGNNSRGVAGIAWNARVMPLRVLGANGGTEYDVQQAIRYAAGLTNDSGTLPPRKADIVNLSFGGPTYSQSGQDTVNQARAAGLIIIAASGNESTNAPLYPAGYDGVIGVSAVDSDRKLASYSNYGADIDVAAPGGNTALDRNGDGVSDGVVSTGGADGTGSLQYNYPVYQGTSMASPHIAGVAALMKAVFPAMTPADFDAMLMLGALTDDLGSVGRDDQYGYGLINAAKAVSAARARAGSTNPQDPPAPLEPLVLVQPTALNFGVNLASTDLVIENIGGPGAAVTAVTSSQSWLLVQPKNVSFDTRLGVYRVLIGREGLEPGTYNGQIVVETNLSKFTIPVIMQINDRPLAADAGVHYVVLVNPETHEVLYKTTVNASGGRYSYALSDVGAGTYHVFAGTDSNQDGQLCEVGEACGAFGSVAQPVSVTVDDASVAGIDFTTTFTISFSANPMAPMAFSPLGGMPNPR